MGFLSDGQPIAGQPGHGHRQGVLAGAIQVGADDARHRQPGLPGRELSPVAVYGHVRDTGVEFVTRDGGDRDDDQRYQDADLGDRRGQLADASGRVPQVLRVLGDLVGG